MRVLVLCRDAGIARIVQGALASDADVFVGSSSDESPGSGFHVVLTDDPALVDHLRGEQSGLSGAALIVVQRRRDELREGPDAPGDLAAAASHDPRSKSGTPSVEISGSEPPSDQDIEVLRRVIAQSERIQTTQRITRLERRTASMGVQLRALLDHTGAKIITVDLLPGQGAAGVDVWLVQTLGERKHDVAASFHPADLHRLRQAIAEFLAQPSATFDTEFRMLGSVGQWEWVRQRAIIGSTYSDGSPQQIFITQTSQTALHRAESLLGWQAKIIEQLVAGDDLEQVLVSLILAIEENYAGALAVVARLDQATGRLYKLAGPSLPDEFHAVFEGLAIGPEVGACGAAAYQGRRVVIEDLTQNESCQPYLEHFSRFHLRSIWSQPILGSDDQILGTFAIYHREQHSPDEAEIRLIETAANLAGLAMERWKQINSLLQNEKRFRQLADLARLFAWDYDIEGRRFTYIGNQVERLLGYTAAQLAEADFWTTIIHPDDLPELGRRIENPARYGDNFSLEYRVIASDGRIVWLQGLFAAVLRNGKAVRMQGFSIDINDRKLAEENLRDSEERYRMLAEYSTDLIGRLDEKATFLYVSPACRSMLGYEREEMIGRCAFDFVHEEDLPTLLPQWNSLERLHHALGTYRIRRADGEYVWFETRGQRRPAKQGHGFEVIATSRDVTDRMEAARKLRQRELELAHAERLGTMGQMAAELAHELNQPLQAISNFAEAAMHWVDHPTDNLEPLRRWTGQISQQARRAGEVVRRILNFVRKGELDPSAFDLTTCVRGLQPLLDVAARSHSAKIEYRLSSELPEVVADQLLIEQVVVNLFRNALEAMLEQPVERRIVTIETFRADDEKVGLAIQDRGRGLATEEVDRLFEPYFTTKSDGTGMGLAICRSTIDAHQGRIWAENNELGGATFRFVLPIEPLYSAQFLR